MFLPTAILFLSGMSVCGVGGAVIARENVLIDRPFGDFGQLLRAPDLRLGDVRTMIVKGRHPFEHRLEDSTRGMFIYALKGDFTLEIEGSDRPLIAAPEGTSAGFEYGRPHRWRSDPPKDTTGSNREVELFISSIPRKMGVLQSLEDGLIIVPPHALPFADIIRHSVHLHIADFLSPMADDDDAIRRRCAEIVLIEFVRYTRSRIVDQPNVPAGLAHDEYLLRAWSAYFADPKRRWTVQALADAAGLGRTTFAERFHRVFGAPPLQTLTSMRLEQAEDMLRHGQAPLIEIAFTVGYNSEAAFVRAFHRAYAVPPGRFRQQHGSRAGSLATSNQQEL